MSRRRARRREWVETMRAVLRFGVISALVAAAALGLRSQPTARVLENVVADRMKKSFPADPTDSLRIVAITDADFENPDLFRSTSPLDPATLERIVRRLAQHRPRTVVLDILLDPVPYEDPARASARLGLLRACLQVGRSESTRWILAASARDDQYLSRCDRAVVEAWHDLQQAPTGYRGGILLAAPVLKNVDYFVRDVDFEISREPGVQLTTLGAFASLSGLGSDLGKQSSRSLEPWTIRYTGMYGGIGTLPRRYAMTVGELLASPSDPTDRTELTGRTVLVGGVYKPSRDTYATPAGKMYAVQIWAEAIDSYLRSDSLRHPSEAVVFLAEVLMGIFTGLLLHRMGLLLGGVVAFLGSFVVAFVLSILAFQVGYIWIAFFFAPHVILLHSWFENAWGVIQRHWVGRRRRAVGA